MAFGFIEGRKTGSTPTRLVNPADPLESAKQHVIAAVEAQIRRVNLLMQGEELPREKGKRNTVWFYKDAIDGDYWTALRYGQFTIPLTDEGDTAVQIGKLPDLVDFYNQVIASIKKGELDQAIGRLRDKRSGRRKRNAAVQNDGNSGENETPPAEEQPAQPSSGSRGSRGSRRARSAGAAATEDTTEDTTEENGVARHW